MPEVPQLNLNLHSSGPTSSSYKSNSDISDLTDDNTQKLLREDAPGSPHWPSWGPPKARRKGHRMWILRTLCLVLHLGLVWFTSAVFVTQKLAIHANFHARRTLTATHDNLSAWGGLGSALASLYNQFYPPASVVGTFVVTAYLGGISLLHVTTPAIFSVAGFNSSSPGLIKVETRGLPSFNQTIGTPNFNQSIPPFNYSDSVNAEISFVNMVLDFLPWIDNLDDSQKLGLFNGTLYDTLQNLQIGRGKTKIPATGFNITCAYLPGVNTGMSSGYWNISLGTSGNFQTTVQLPSSGPNILTATSFDPPPSALIVYTTNPVVDSTQSAGAPILLTSPMGNGSVTQVQFMVCSRGLVPQQGIVDGETGLLFGPSLQPSIYKTYSSWQSYTDVPLPAGDSTLLGGNAWSELIFYNPITSSSSSVGVPFSKESTDFEYLLSSVDLFLMDRLALDPSWIITGLPPSFVPVLTLHDIENALSELVATLFWIIGHLEPDQLEMRYSGTVQAGSLGAELVPPLLTPGNTQVPQYILLAQLEMSLIAVSIGLGTSVLLFAIAITYCFSPSADPVAGTGPLHVIWMCKNRPTLFESLPQVSDPTDFKLRTAALIPIQFSEDKEQLELPSPNQWPPSRHSGAKAVSVLSYRFAEPNKIPVTSSYKLLCLVLHCFLVGVHIVLLIIALSSHAEHRLVFPVEAQKTISLWITLISIGPGTVSLIYFRVQLEFHLTASVLKLYLAATLFLTQTIAIQRSLCTHQTLTATHDQTLSWKGLGSALSTLCSQCTLPASVYGTLCIAGYLASVGLMHVTIPALVAVQTFNRTVPTVVETQGLPVWNTSDANTSALVLENLEDFLLWMNLLDESQTVGLFNGSLYDVLAQSNPADTAPQVSATGFDVTCGYLPNVIPTNITKSNIDSSLIWNISLGDTEPPWFLPSPSGPNIITMEAMLNDDFNEQPGVPNAASWTSLILYTTNKVLDSAGNSGSPVILDPPMGPNASVTELQVLRCARSIVNQSASVEPQSRLLIPSSLNPSLHKTTSKWHIYEPEPKGDGKMSPLESGLWPMPFVDGPAISSVLMSVGVDDGRTFSSLDVYLMEKLNLDPSWIGTGVAPPSATIYLHDIENALAQAAAAIFWIAGHIHPLPLVTKYSLNGDGDPAQKPPPVLSAGSTIVNRTEVAARLELNVPAIMLGLASSILSALLAIKFIRGNKAAHTSLRNMGILHIIWMYRDQPLLTRCLEHLDDPTDRNLRAAGMVKFQLVPGAPNVGWS
ncbi:hypothetical protein GGX14DRAFT_569876 [Mycena pura]|uniref:Uncharacterized protein n=1 Tax=Mycena pura TaxID=153505 RepID=A0AAD6VDC7_9AGAR|nr:hypothetical protein GGX14DRAFT_569876 [Mycena pura]